MDPGRPWRFGFTVLLALGMASGTFLATAFGVLSKFLIDDFDLSRSQIGLLVTTFAAGGASLSPLIGRIADAIGGRSTLLLTYGVAGVTLLGVAGSPTYLWLMATALAAGLAQAASNPGTNKLIRLHVPAGKRGFITGVKQSGVNVGTFLGGALLPAGAVAIGWRQTIAISAMIPFAVLAVAIWLIPPDEPVTEQTSRSELAPWIWWLTAYGFLMGVGGGALFTYVPLYAQEGLDLSVTAGGAAAATIGFVGIAARILWGKASERLRHFTSALAAIAALSVAFTVVLWAAQHLGTWLLWLGAAGIGLSATAWNAVGMLAVITASGRSTGGASGIVVAGFIAGLAVGPPLFGLSVDETGSYQSGLLAVAGVFAIATGLTALWARIRT